MTTKPTPVIAMRRTHQRLDILIERLPKQQKRTIEQEKRDLPFAKAVDAVLLAGLSSSAEHSDSDIEDLISSLHDRFAP